MATKFEGPLYMQVADELEGTIARRAPGDLLPSEHELARTYDVSRLTARAALEELERRYLVSRAQGRGTFVARRLEYNIGSGAAPSFSATVRAAGGVPGVETETLRLRQPPASVRASLRLKANDPAIFLARRRFVDGDLAAYAQTWLAADLVPNLADVLAETESLHDAFERVYRLRPVRSRSRAEFVIAPAAISKKLGTPGRPMVFLLTGGTDSAKHGRPIQITSSWLRSDRFRVVFDMGTGE